MTLGYFANLDPTVSGVDYLMSLLPISHLYRFKYGVFGGVMFSVAIELQFYLIFRCCSPRGAAWVVAISSRR